MSIFFEIIIGISKIPGAKKILQFFKLFSSNALVAPVYLPQGAVVTNIEVFYVDNSTANMDISFDRRGLTGGLSVISSASTSTNSTIVNTLNLTGTNIDNANNSYNIRVFSSGWSTNTTKTMDIRTIKITYTITETD